MVCQSLASCGLIKLRSESTAFYTSTALVGRIGCQGPCRGPIYVMAFRRDGNGEPELAHRVLLHEAGGYELIVPKGVYSIFAFNDANGNGRLDSNEPIGVYDNQAPLVVNGTALITPVDFSLATAFPAAARRALKPVADTPQAPTHSTQAGAIVDLEAPQFSAASGVRGYWSPVEFFREMGGNIYFLEPYDPKRIPVLFVHGAAGSAQDWRNFVTHLDRSRYQAWFYIYPSGSAVESMANLLHWKLINLQLRYRFDTLHLVAHSMGGLVARTCLLNSSSALPKVRLFISLSTPWAGEPLTELGVRHSPAVVPSWHDMQPGGTFMTSLFAKRLPANIDHYLLFGHKGGYNMLRPNTDGTVTLASQLRGPAQTEARMVLGFDEDHVSILRSQQVVDQFNAILRRHDNQHASQGDTGRVQVDFSVDSTNHSLRAQPMLLLRPVAAPSSLPASSAGHSSAYVWIPLSVDDNGKPTGSVPTGLFDASLIAPAFRATPNKLRLQIDPDTVTSVRVSFAPQGVLNGFVHTQSEPNGLAAGTHPQPNEAVKIRSITLRGANVFRELAPTPAQHDDLFEPYVNGNDALARTAFSFVGLPEGTYEVTILADGWRPHTSRHVVVPGQPSPASFLMLERGP